jgi:hypothetical protein
MVSLLRFGARHAGTSARVLVLEVARNACDACDACDGGCRRALRGVVMPQPP